MPGEAMVRAVFRHIGLAEDIPGNSLHALVGPGDPGDLAFHRLVSFPIIYFDAFSSREPVSTPDRVRGRLSLENAPVSCPACIPWRNGRHNSRITSVRSL